MKDRIQIPPEVKHIHCIGVGGSGMFPIIQILHSRRAGGKHPNGVAPVLQILFYAVKSHLIASTNFFYPDPKTTATALRRPVQTLSHSSS